MNYIFILLFSFLSISCFSQNSLIEKSNSSIINIPTHLDFRIDKDTLTKIRSSEISLTTYESNYLEFDTLKLTILSFVDSDSSMQRNWDKSIEKYRNENCLIIVSYKDDMSRSGFITYFHEQRAKGNSIQKSYLLTVEKFQNKNSDLKYCLFINSRQIK